MAFQFILSCKAVVSSMLAPYDIAREILSAETVDDFGMAYQVRSPFKGAFTLRDSTEVIFLFLAKVLFAEVNFMKGKGIPDPVIASRDWTSNILASNSAKHLAVNGISARNTFTCCYISLTLIPRVIDIH